MNERSIQRGEATVLGLLAERAKLAEDLEFARAVWAKLSSDRKTLRDSYAAEAAALVEQLEEMDVELAALRAVRADIEAAAPPPPTPEEAAAATAARLNGGAP